MSVLNSLQFMERASLKDIKDKVESIEKELDALGYKLSGWHEYHKKNIPDSDMTIFSHRLLSKICMTEMLLEEVLEMLRGAGI